jgi:hypothetical protein
LPYINCNKLQYIIQFNLSTLDNEDSISIFKNGKGLQFKYTVSPISEDIKWIITDELNEEFPIGDISSMIKEAAILKDDIIYTGKRDSDILRNATPFGYLRDGEQGFIMYNGKFVDRFEGLDIALKYGQIKIKTGNPNMLFSEDLY